MKTKSYIMFVCGFLLISIAGCASSSKTKTMPVSSPAAADAVPVPVVSIDAEEMPEFVEREIEPDPTEPEVPVDPVTEKPLDVDRLFESARKACAGGLFGTADSMMREAAKFLARGGLTANAGAAADADTDAGDGGARLTLREYVAEIISFYAELMPPVYSVPDEISVMVFNRHLLETLMDTLRISPTDSIFLARLSNKTGVVYDVPMVWNDRVRRALISYMRTRRGSFDRWLHRAGYYLPPMKQMFADSGLPQDLAYLPIIESAFNPQAYSRAHAAGIWQFIPSTGRNYGLRQNYWLDERRDPLKATEAAIKYLRKLHGDFGNWHIALASYNCGENGMARAIKKAGGLYDYWKLKLPKETMNYVPLYLASVIIAKNQDVFEYAIQDSLIYDPDTVTVNDCVEMKTIADGLGLGLDTLKALNPQILHWCTPPDLKNVRLYLPKGYAEAFNTFYSELPDEKKTKFYRYKIQSGDNLQQIARNFRVPVEALREINNMTGNAVSANKFLIIPIPVNEDVPASLVKHLNQSEKERASYARNKAPRRGRKTTYKVRAGETIYSISNTFGVPVSDLLSWNFLPNARALKAEQTLVIYLSNTSPAPAPTTQRVRGNSSEHTGKRLVRQGDTLYSIALELGLTVSELAQINGLDARRPLIYPGDVLVYTPKRTGAE